MLSDDPDFERKAADVIGLYVEPRSMPPSSLSMRRPPFRRSIVWTPCSRSPPVARNGTASSTTSQALTVPLGTCE